MNHPLACLRGLALAATLILSVPAASAQCQSWSVDSNFPQFNERFASSVATDGGTWVTGSPGYLGAGRAQVFSSTAAGAAFESYLWPGGLVAQDSFGAAVAVHGDVIAVGAPGDDVGNFGSGAVYVFERFLGKWVYTTKLKAALPSTSASFGAALAVGDGWIAVGAPFDSSFKTFSGRTTVFLKTSAGWVLENEFAGAQPLDRLGSSLAMAGDQLFIGVPGAGAGRVETFRLSDDQWVPEQVLAATNGKVGDEFGSSIAIDDYLAVVGARSDSVVAPGAGAAYVFGLANSVWIEMQRLQGNVPMNSDRFGGSVAIIKGFIAVGAPGSYLVAQEGGAATFFANGSFDGITYKPFESKKHLLPLGASGGEQFASTLAMSPYGMWIGAPGEDTSEANAGRAHAFSFVDIGCSSLSVGPAEVSAQNLKTIHFEINAGKKFAGKPYFLLGSAQPFTTPTLVGGMALPLTLPDDYGFFLIYNANKGGQMNTVAYLDANGRGSASIDLTQVNVPLLNGMQLKHAFFVFNEVGLTKFTSSVVTVKVIF